MSEEHDFDPDDIENHETEIEEEKPKVEEFREIGGSPMPGVTLQHVLRGHTKEINRMAWSPDGRYLASPSDDKTVRIWEVSQEDCIAILEGHTAYVHGVVWSADGKMLASGSGDHSIRIWDISLKKCVKTLNGHSESVYCIAWASDGNTLVSGSSDQTICFWDLENGQLIERTNRQNDIVVDLSWSPDQNFIAASGGGSSRSIKIWDANSRKIISSLDGHDGAVSCVTWFKDSRMLISSGSVDNTIRIWDTETGRALRVLESHTGNVRLVSPSADNSLLASKSLDGSIRLWETKTWPEVASFHEEMQDQRLWCGLAFNPISSTLASLSSEGQNIRIWNIDVDVLLGSPNSKPIFYTTAKLVLVGDSGVGKTGLGWRLAHDEFKEHSSTHGQQFWVVPELKKTRGDGTECEAVLWDLAGQHIYRSIHSIFLDDVDASLVLFDPTNRQEPLKGAQFWLEQLKGKKQLPPSVLVGARLDRGTPVLSQQELDQFCQKYGISGGFIGTSAKSGEGVDKLLDILKAQIPWDQMTTTVTTVTFKKIKDHVLSLKEKPDRRGVLVKPDDLRRQLEVTDKDWQFTDAEMMTAVGHLENHGYVTILHSSAGEKCILLVPELLATIASSIVLLADKNPHELGAVSETDLLQGKIEFEELVGLDKSEQQILIDAAVYRFLDHNICFRERSTNDVFLIFPSLIKQKRPLQEDFQSIDDVSYIVRGRVENIYAALVVLLGYTSTFNRRNQWQSQAQYEMGQGEICGFRLTEEREGELELVLYYSTTTPTYGRTLFQGLFESFLYKRDVEITRFPPVHCGNGHLIERTSVIKRVRDQKTLSFVMSVVKEQHFLRSKSPKLLAKEHRQMSRLRRRLPTCAVYTRNI